MPKLSRVIESLNQQLTEHGDVEVHIEDWADGTTMEIVDIGHSEEINRVVLGAETNHDILGGE